MAWRVIRSATIVAIALSIFVGCSDQGSEVLSSRPVSESALDRAFVAGDAIPGAYIVVLKSDARDVPAAAFDMARTYGLTRGFIYQHAIKGYSALIPPARLRAVESDPRVAYVEPDRIVSLGPVVAERITATVAQTTPWGIARVGGAASGVGKTVWVIDTGVDLTNADLTVNVTRSRSFVTGRSSPKDENGHGTHVAGTIAAKDNGIDVVGVAAGATVVSVRVLNKQGSGTISGVVAGVNYVASNGKAGDVANMSLGGGASTTLDNAVINAAAKGVKFALAAGNEATNAGTRSPARTNGTNIYTVSAIDASDVFAYFSNYGNPPVDYAAPGVSVTSLRLGGGTVTYSGTSMSAPHVAGILLLGNATTDGAAKSDPDGNADPIAHR